MKKGKGSRRKVKVSFKHIINWMNDVDITLCF